MEFATFTIKEFQEGTRTEKSYIVGIQRHKTTGTGLACIVLDHKEEELIKNYIEFYRPYITDCKKPDPISTLPEHLHSTSLSYAETT